MAWMFRWLEQFLTRLRPAGAADPKWVEPSNAITRAILAGAVAELPTMAAPPQPVEITEVADPVEEPPAEAEPAAARRAGRAA